MATSKHRAAHGFGKGGAGFYSAGFGNIPCGMRKIMPGISIISTLTRLNMDTWNPCKIGLTQLFTAGLNKKFTRRIGAVKLMGSWSFRIWILLL